MNVHLTLIALPVALAWFARLLRRPGRSLADLAPILRDLITLRLVLRDTEPDQRAALLNAHRSWRTEPAKEKTAKRRTRRRPTRIHN